jgi:hypothetical protein
MIRYITDKKERGGDARCQHAFMVSRDIPFSNKKETGNQKQCAYEIERGV